MVGFLKPSQKSAYWYGFALIFRLNSIAVLAVHTVTAALVMQGLCSAEGLQQTPIIIITVAV